MDERCHGEKSAAYREGYDAFVALAEGIGAAVDLAKCPYPMGAKDNRRTQWWEGFLDHRSQGIPTKQRGRPVVNAAVVHLAAEPEEENQ